MNWRKNAYCGEKDPALWESAHAPSARAAEMLCKPCTVRRHCAEWALTAPYLCGVVVAGVAFPEKIGEIPAIEAARERIANSIGVPYERLHDDVRPPRFCAAETCGREMFDGNIGRTYPGQVPYGGRGMCKVCYQRTLRHEKAATS